MNTITFSRQTLQFGSRIMSPLRKVISFVETVISIALLVIARFFLLWLNQKQDELDYLEDKPEKK